MSYAICRVAKIKSQSQLAQAQGHNMRQRETFNADPLRSQDNEILHGSAFVRDDVNKRLEETGVKIRKDSVISAEMVLTASPEFFDSDVSLKDWKKANVDFLKERYGDNLINVVCHNDEKTPHLHAIITPIMTDEDNNRLSMKEFLGGKQTLRELQSDYAEAMKPFGLDRGIEKSVAHHQDIKSYYSNIEEAKKIAHENKDDFKEQMKVKIKIDVPEPEGKFFKTISPEAAKQNTVEHLQEYKKEVNKKLDPLYDQMIDLAYENKMLREENKQLKQVAGSLNQDNELLRRREKRFDHMRDLCPEESQKLQESYKNRVREIEEKRKQEEEIKKQQALVEKQEREKRIQEAAARRPKGESTMDNNPEPKPQPQPEQQPQEQEQQHYNPRPRF